MAIEKEETLERGTKTPKGKYMDLRNYDYGCSLLRTTIGAEGHPGVEVACGSWGAMKGLFDANRKKNDGFRYHIGLPNGARFPDDYIEYDTDGITFLFALREGKTTLADLDDWVDAWHEGAGVEGVTLREYLGFTTEQYQTFVLAPENLTLLVTE